jgi:hypothetical protein
MPVMPDASDPMDLSLRLVSDDFLSQLDGLLALEERKRVTPVDDPTFPALADQVQEAARRLLAQAAEQATRAEDVHSAALASGASSTIEDMPEELIPAQILALWREADQERRDVPVGSARWQELGIRIEALRRSYQRAYDRYRSDS